MDATHDMAPVAAKAEERGQFTAPPGSAPKPRPDSIVTLKPGGGAPPLFCVAGIGGQAMELRIAARLIRYAGAVYGNEYRGIQHATAPQRLVSEMADFQVAAIRRVQPTGPYNLLGYSFGGLIAFEMARRLLLEGESVAFLGLVEAPIHEKWWPVRVRVAFALRRLREHGAVLRSTPMSRLPAYLSERVSPFLGRLNRLLLGGRSDSVMLWSEAGLPKAMVDVRRASIDAFNAYEPTRLHFHVSFFRSEIGNRLSCDSVEVMSRYVDSFDIRPISGDHATMLRHPHANVLAKQIDLALAEAWPEHQPD